MGEGGVPGTKLGEELGCVTSEKEVMVDVPSREELAEAQGASEKFWINL